VIYDIIAQALSIIMMNWAFFLTVQGVVFFRKMLLYVWRKSAFFIAGTIGGIFSSVAVVLSLLLGIAFICGKEGSIYLSEYQSDHIFPLVSAICLEFAELIVYLFKYFIVRHTIKEKNKTSTVKLFVEKIKSLVTMFQKPNLAMLQ
jgi:hypothetical protein